MEIEGSWKGKVWYLYFIWPFVVISLLYQPKSTEPREDSWWQIAILIIGTIIWFIGTYYLIKRIKESFSRPKFNTETTHEKVQRDQTSA